MLSIDAQFLRQVSRCVNIIFVFELHNVHWKITLPKYRIIVFKVYAFSLHTVQD